MKTVSGEVVSSTGVTVSKAAKILSKFASSDNGAFAAYLQRSSASFDELAQLHKTIGSEHKVKKHLAKKKHKKSVSRSC